MSLGQLPRIALIQLDVQPGRPDLNVRRMLHFVDRARERRAEIVVFSELCIPGYIVGDVWEVDALVEDYAAWSESLRSASEGMTIVFGNVAYATTSDQLYATNLLTTTDANILGRDGAAGADILDGVSDVGLPASRSHGKRSLGKASLRSWAAFARWCVAQRAAARPSRLRLLRARRPRADR